MSKRRAKTKSGGFTRLTHFLQNTPAWRCSGPIDRAVYLELARLYTAGTTRPGVRGARRLRALPDQ
jgi:hypothetical protein